MGISGAAIATGIAHVAIIALYVSHFLSKNSTIKFARFRPDFALLGREFKNGLPSGITELSTGIIIFLFNQAILRFLNEDALVSYSIISYVNSLAIMTMVGIAQGYQPLVSYYYGKKQPDRYQKLFRYGVVAAAALSVAFTLVCWILGSVIVSLFVSPENRQLHAYSVQVLRIFSLSFLVAGYNIVIGGYFTAVEMPAAATIISISRSLLLLTLSLTVLTAIFYGDGIWWAPVMSELLTLGLTLFFFLRNRANSQKL